MVAMARGSWSDSIPGHHTRYCYRCVAGFCPRRRATVGRSALRHGSAECVESARVASDEIVVEMLRTGIRQDLAVRFVDDDAPRVDEHGPVVREDADLLAADPGRARGRIPRHGKVMDEAVVCDERGGRAGFGIRE